ncbi:MAG TPA: ATP-binding protein [Burkholderiales bacterium]|nr:ATP-binding protein [Burkholderiales bacterium]
MSEARYRRLLSRPRNSFFLFGPRGVGKSTWTRTQLAGAHRIDLLDETVYQDLLVDASLFAAELNPLVRGSWVVVDEIQRLPALLNQVHRLIEERRLRFALLGSSARKLKTAGTNLLAGRALRKQMFPLTPEELGADFDLETVLRFGSVALIWQAADRRATLGAYVQTYLREEIRAESIVRNLPGFARFLPVAALMHGQVINVAGIARDAGTARTTVDGYLEILEDTLLAWRLPAYEAKLRVRERKHPKLFWVDPGIVRAVKRQLDPPTAEERGHLFEGWVLMLLRCCAEEQPLFDEIFYWAPTQARQLEVDFLLRRGRELLAIEVKTGRRFQSGMLAGLSAIKELRHVVRRILVYGGTRRLRMADGVEVWPLDTLLDAIARKRLWP